MTTVPRGTNNFAITAASKRGNEKGLKTLFITSDASAVAGVGPCLADVLERLDRDLITPIVICPWEKIGSATIISRLEAQELPLYTRDLGKWMPSPNEWGWRHFLSFGSTLKRRVWSLASLIEREGIDLVYSNGLPCIDGALAARLTKRPHIWHLHEAIRENPDLRQYIPSWLTEKIVGRLSQTVIVNSRFLADELARVSRYAPIKVVHNGVDIHSITSGSPSMDGDEVRRELKIEQGTPIVLAIGTVAPRKGYEVLIEAASRVLAVFPQVVFLIAGAVVSDHADELRKLLARRGLSKQFLFLGPRGDVPRLLAAAQIMVHSAHQETFGRVLLEAMAAGKPVVTTRSGGPQEVVLDGETGYLVPVNDPKSIADRLIELLGSPELCRKLGNAGHQRAIGNFSVEHYAEEVVNIISEVARHRKAENELAFQQPR